MAVRTNVGVRFDRVQQPLGRVREDLVKIEILPASRLSPCRGGQAIETFHSEKKRCGAQRDLSSRAFEWVEIGAAGPTRTDDLTLTKRLLYQLSYSGVEQLPGTRIVAERAFLFVLHQGSDNRTRVLLMSACFVRGSSATQPPLTDQWWWS